MAYSKQWVETEPDGAVITVSQLDNYQRDTKIALRERLELDPTNPLQGIFEAGSFPTGAMPAKGSGRFYAGLVGSISGATLQDGRGYFTTDANAVSNPRLFHMEGAGSREIAYLNRDGSRPLIGDLTVQGNFEATNRIRTLSDGSVLLGNPAVDSPSTAGWPWMPKSGAAPSGVPAILQPDYVPFVYDTVNNRFYVYNVGWKSVPLT